MKNKYRINTWDPKGSWPMYRIIIDLISELNESLGTPLMKESKSDEEVRRILNNPEGIRIKELQVIDVWSTGRELRKELRDELDEAYAFLSTEATQLIVDRNEIENRAEEGNIGISNENRKLKETIVSKCQEMEKMVENYEKKGELSEQERKLLVYVRKVYSKALKEAVKNLFSTASSSTERVKIFPRGEQEAITNKINSLQKRIRSLTRKSKQKQKESYAKLVLEKNGLEAKLTSLKNTINSSFPSLIDNESRVSEEIWKSIADDLAKLKEVQQQVGGESEMRREITQKLNNLIAEIKTKTSQALDWVSTRSYLGKVKDDLEKITTELANSSNPQLSTKLTSPGIIKKTIPTESNKISEKDKELIQDIANEFSHRLKSADSERKTIEIIFESVEGINAYAEWKTDYSSFRIGIDPNQDRIQAFGSLAHELAHSVIFLKELEEQSESAKNLYPHQAHSKSFWKVFLDEDTISVPNDISTLEFVKSKLSKEDRSQFDDFIKVESKKNENKVARWVYFPDLRDESDSLENKMRRKKILNTRDQTKAKAEWDKVRRNVLQWVDDSMNTPASEAKSNWENLFLNADKEKRWVRVEVWQRKENEEKSDQGKYKIYVFHNQDAPEDLIKKLNEGLTDDEVGEWEPVIKIDKEKDERLEERKLPNICGKVEENEPIQAQVLQIPKTK